QNLVFGEEQNIAHQAADGFRGRQVIDSVLRTLFQEKKSRDRSAAVLSRFGQFSSERCAKRRVRSNSRVRSHSEDTAGAGIRTNVRNFVAKQSNARRRQPGQGGFARAGYS